MDIEQNNENSGECSDISPEERARYEKRAPGWRIRCKKCGFTQPYGKYGIRRYAAGKKCTLGWCSRCHRICCHFIEKKDVTKNPYRDNTGTAEENPYRAD